MKQHKFYYIDNYKLRLVEIKRIYDNEKKFFVEKYGLDRYTFFKHKKYGLPVFDIKSADSVRSRKGGGSNIDPPNNHKDNNVFMEKRKYNKYIPYDFDASRLSQFDFERLKYIKPDKKFNILLNREFNNNFYSEEEQLIYESRVKRYYKLKEEGKLNEINEYFQKISAYLREVGDNDDKYYDGSVIVRLAFILKKLIETNKWMVKYDDFNNLKNLEEIEGEDMEFYLFLLLQCFTTKNHYVNLTFSEDDNSNENWHSINCIRRRWSQKGFRSKGQAYCKKIIKLFKYECRYEMVK